MSVDQLIPTMNMLNSMLPESERLEQFKMKNEATGRPWKSNPPNRDTDGYYANHGQRDNGRYNDFRYWDYDPENPTRTYYRGPGATVLPTPSSEQ